MTATVASGRLQAVARARLLNRITIGWNAVECLVAIAAGVAAGSVSLVGFGLDSAVEVSAAVVLTWRLAQERRGGCMAAADRRAARGVALSFAALGVWVAYEATRQLVTAARPSESVAGIILATASLLVMPLLARSKRRLATPLGSRAVASEARQTALCAVLSGVLLGGLGLHAAFGWWWADPLAALTIAGIAAAEAIRTWRADSLADTCCA